MKYNVSELELWKITFVNSVGDDSAIPIAANNIDNAIEIFRNSDVNFKSIKIVNKMSDVILINTP